MSDTASGGTVTARKTDRGYVNLTARWYTITVTTCFDDITVRWRITQHVLLMWTQCCEDN